MLTVRHHSCVHNVGCGWLHFTLCNSHGNRWRRLQVDVLVTAAVRSLDAISYLTLLLLGTITPTTLFSCFQLLLVSGHLLLFWEGLLLDSLSALHLDSRMLRYGPRGGCWLTVCEIKLLVWRSIILLLMRRLSVISRAWRYLVLFLENILWWHGRGQSDGGIMDEFRIARGIELLGWVISTFLNLRLLRVWHLTSITINIDW